MTTDFHIRTMKSDDRSRVWQWWLRVLKKGSPSVPHRSMAKVVDDLIDDDRVSVLVGEHPGVGGEPLGFIAHRGTELLMVYVVDNVEGIPVRRNGLGTQLLDEAMGGAARPEPKHWTTQGTKLLKHWMARKAAKAA